MGLYTETGQVINIKCTIYGANSGTPEDAFICASGTDPSLLQLGLFGLIVALFLLFWVRLIHQAWKKFLNSDYTIKDVGNIVLMPAFLFVIVAVLVSYWGMS